MITDTLHFSGLTTKIKAMESRFISFEDYNQISNLTSVTEFVSFLKSHPAYGKLLENTDENNLHRGEIERIISRSLFSDFVRIYKFASFKQRNFLNLILMKYEIFMLKRCLGFVFDKRDIPPSFVGASDFFRKYSDLDISSLLSSQNIGEFITNLKGSNYYDIFSKLLTTNHQTLFEFESQLDIYYFTELWRQKDKLFKKRELDVITNTFGHEIDLLNILWIYRSKKYYNVNSSNIYTYIIPINYKLKKSEMNTLIETPGVDEFVNSLRNTYYAKIYKDLSHDQIEVIYNRILHKMYRKFRLKYPYSVAIVSNYLYSKEREIDKLTTALECIRYGLSPSDIMAYTTQATNNLV